MRCAVLLVPLLLLSGNATAAETPSSPGLACTSAIQDAERNAKLPAGLLPAIGRVESGRADPRTGRVQPWPWTINAEGAGHYYESKEEAIAAVEALQARGVRSIDVGCMQVNLMHHPNAFATLDAAFDPVANASYAGRFLAALYGQAASWPVAAGYYHSQTPDLADGYRYAVMHAWGRPDLAGAGPGLTRAPVPPLPPERAAYRDFATPAQSAYGAFAPQAAVYGAFAQVGVSRPLPAPSRVAAARSPLALPSPAAVRLASTR